MKSTWLIIIIGCTLALVFKLNFSLAIGIVITLYFFLLLIVNSNTSFAFRELIIVIYSVNYLIAPSITYLLPEAYGGYFMRIGSEEYFNLATPGIVCFIVGIYFIKTKIFQADFSEVKLDSFLNETFLRKIFLFSILIRLVINLIPTEFTFLFYLLALFRFVSGFALFSIKIRKYWYWILFLYVLEFYFAFIDGMYHDALMWLIFFGVFLSYLIRPSISYKLYLGFVFIVLIFFIQAIKKDYRSLVWSGERQGNISTAFDVGFSKSSTKEILADDNLLATLSRSNQAWIFSSTVDRMNAFKDFQGLALVGNYVEAALLPRFLAPNKIKSGDREVFNKFSGHQITAGTSMGLGLFADGYIAYGPIGVYIFGFALGLIFSLTFMLVQHWSRVSQVYILFIFPLLIYAIRPDCELQTTINHLAKGILVFGIAVYLTSGKFFRKVSL